MKRSVLIIFALVVPAAAWAQGVNDPSTPNRNVIIVNPPQPSPSTATRNIPSRIEPPVTSGSARPYYGNRTRGSESSRR